MLMNISRQRRCMAHSSCCMGCKGLQYYARCCDYRRPCSKRSGRRQKLEGSIEDHYVCPRFVDSWASLTGFWRSEPEAAAVHCAHLTNLHQLKPSQNFMICDAGGGTVDLAVYRIIGQLQSLEIAEVCARSGSNCGSIFL